MTGTATTAMITATGGNRRADIPLRRRDGRFRAAVFFGDGAAEFGVFSCTERQMAL